MKTASKEPMSNIGAIHSSCAATRKAEYQSVPHEYKVGDYVQKAFKDPSSRIVENMWVEVERLNKVSLIGILDNDPVAVKGLKCGDKVIVKFSEIFQHIKKDPK